jgi:hypothetical protein
LEDLIIVDAAIKFRNVPDLVTVGPEDFDNDVIDILVGEEVHYLPAGTG